MIKSLIGFIFMTSSDVLNRPISSVPIFLSVLKTEFCQVILYARRHFRVGFTLNDHCSFKFFERGG